MSDSLTRLILRAQGRPLAVPATAEPLLASRYEGGSAPVLSEAAPGFAHEIDADPASDRAAAESRRAASDPVSPRAAQTSGDRIIARPIGTDRQ